MAKKFDLKGALAKANKAWASKGKEQAAKDRFEEYDDGSYVAKLKNIEIGPTRDNPRKLMAIITWRFLEGDYAGKTHKSFRPLTDDKGAWDIDKLANFARFEIRQLGYSIDGLDDLSEDLPNIFKELNKDNPVCRIQLKTTGEYTNTNVRKVLDDDEYEDETEDDEDDDAPAKSKKKAGKKKAAADDDEDEDEDADEDADEDDEEDAPAPKKKGKKKAAEEEDEDEDADADDEDDDEDEKPAPKKKGKKPAPKDDDEEEDADEDADEDEPEAIAVAVGSKVKVQTKAGMKKGTITEIFEDDNKVKVEFADGKELKLSAEKITEVLDPPAKPKGKKKR